MLSEIEYDIIANKVAMKVMEYLDRPKSLFICQKKAFALYGQSNVLNWRANGQITVVKRVRKIEYKVSELDALGDRRNLLIKPKRK